MKLVDSLYDRKDAEIIAQEIFDKWWYVYGKNAMQQLLTQIMVKSDDKYFCRFMDVSSLSVDIKSDFLFYHPTTLFYKMLRSKLWNEGINFKMDLDLKTYFSFRNPEDKYDDCIIFISEMDVEYIVSNFDYLTNLAIFAGTNTGSMWKAIQKNYYKNKNDSPILLTQKQLKENLQEKFSKLNNNKTDNKTDKTHDSSTRTKRSKDKSNKKIHKSNKIKSSKHTTSTNDNDITVTDNGLIYSTEQPDIPVIEFDPPEYSD